MSSIKNEGKNHPAFPTLLDLFSKVWKETGKSKALKTEDEFKAENQEQLGRRDIHYTAMIETFVKTYADRQNKKEDNKWIFYWFVLIGFAVCILLPIALIVIILILFPPEDIARATPVIIGAFVSLISSLIALPLTIAKYLFNPKEDKEITNMVIKMQEQDLGNRNLLLKKLEEVNRTVSDSEQGGNGGANG